MELVMKIFIGFLVPLEVTSLLLCLLLVYCFYAVLIIRKPPGSLMLGQIILICLMHTVQGIYISIIFFDNSSDSAKVTVLILLELIAFYLLAAYSNYEIFILLELYKRITGDYMRKAYSRRVKIYHIVAHLIAFAFTLSSGLVLLFNSDYKSSALWIFICYPLAQVLVSVVFISLTASKVSKLHNSHTKKFIKQTLMYISALDSIKLVLIVIFCLRIQVYEDFQVVNGNSLICILVLISMGFDMIILIFRLNDPYIKEFLQQKVRILLRKMKRRFISIKNTVTFESHTDENMNNLLTTKTFEDINIENIEYQLIALSIAMFKKDDSVEDTCSINVDSFYSTKTNTTEINFNDLYILNSPEVQNKYSNFRCEYKQYAPDVFQDILAKEGIDLNEIANSLFIEDNQESIKKFLSSEENKENYFITHDEKYILKTLSKEEQRHFIRHTLKQYHQRIIENSFLHKIYGLYKLTYKGVQVRVMLQKNHYKCLSQLTEIFPISDKIQLLSRFKIIPTDHSDISIQIDDESRNRLFHILARDLEFLKVSKIINYSIKIIHLEDPTHCPLTFQSTTNGQSIHLGFCLMNIFTKNKKTVYGIFKKRHHIFACAKKYADEILDKLDSIITS